MAANKLIFCIILLLIEISGVDRKRAGGSRSTRGGRSRGAGNYDRTSLEKSYNNVVLSGRIIVGSSPFTSSTWRSAAIMGSIYGGLDYIMKHPYENKLPPICTNNKERSPEGRVYGYFICPREREPDDYTYCCGTENRENCCNKTIAQIFYSEQKKSTGASIGFIIGVILLVILIFVLGAYCCKKRKHAEDVVRKLSDRVHRSPQHLQLQSLGLLHSRFPKGKPYNKPGHGIVELTRPMDACKARLNPPIIPPFYNLATKASPVVSDTDSQSQPLPHFEDDKPELQTLGEHTLGNILSYPTSGETLYQPLDGAVNSSSDRALHSTLNGPPYSLSDDVPCVLITPIQNSPSNRDLCSSTNRSQYSPSGGVPLNLTKNSPSAGDIYSPSSGVALSPSIDNPFSNPVGATYPPLSNTLHSPLTGDAFLPPHANPYSPSSGASHLPPMDVVISPSTCCPFTGAYPPLNNTSITFSATYSNSPFNPYPSMDETTYIHPNRSTLLSHGGLPYSKSEPPYLPSSPNPSVSPYTEIFYSGSASGAACDGSTPYHSSQS